MFTNVPSPPIGTFLGTLCQTSSRTLLSSRWTTRSRTRKGTLIKYKGGPGKKGGHADLVKARAENTLKMLAEFFDWLDDLESQTAADSVSPYGKPQEVVPRPRASKRRRTKRRKCRRQSTSKRGGYKRPLKCVYRLVCTWSLNRVVIRRRNIEAPMNSGPADTPVWRIQPQLPLHCTQLPFHVPFVPSFYPHSTHLILTKRKFWGTANRIPKMMLPKLRFLAISLMTEALKVEAVELLKFPRAVECITAKCRYLYQRRLWKIQRGSQPGH